MDLTELAAKETPALVERMEREIAELAGRLAAAAAADREVAVERVAAEAHAAAELLREEIAARTADLTTVSASLADAHAEIAQLRADVEGLRGTLRQADTLLETAHRELADARAAHGRAESAHTDALATTRAEHADALTRAAAEHAESLARARAEHAEALARARAEHADVLAETRVARAEAAEARGAHARAESERAEAVAARDRETAARTLAETELQDLREIIQEHERARLDIEARLEAAARRDGAAAALLDGLLSGFMSLSSATTIPDVLTTLVEQLAAEFPRIALFRPKGNRLEGQHQIGFDLTTDITKIVMPLGLDSLPSRAVASGRIESINGPEESGISTGPFGGSPTCAVSLPVIVQGETLAVIYADDWGNDRQDTAPERAVRIKYCDAMLQHALALLMRLTNELKVMAELRAYAGSLLSEIEQMYSADQAADKSGDELRRRLHANVEYARSIFATRVAFECPEAGTLIEDEIAAAVERQQGTPFGRDLEAAAGTQAPEKKRA